MEDKRLHLEFLQASVSRMASNMFQLKGWCIAVVTALVAFLRESVSACLLTVFLTAVFWFLDAYYLQQEQLFRKLYDKVTKQDPNKIDFSMNTDKFKKKAGAGRNKNKKKVGSVCKLMFTGISTYPFYGSIVIILLVFFFWNTAGGNF